MVIDWHTHIYCYRFLLNLLWCHTRCHVSLWLQPSCCCFGNQPLCGWIWVRTNGEVEDPLQTDRMLTYRQLWGPLSEIPQIGRNLVYIPTLVVFLCLQIPTALAGNLGTLLAMRFLGGFVASPVLAVGGGSIVDIFEPHYIPYCLGIWGSLAALGPVLGPLFGGYAYQNHGWRWPMWVVCWMSGFTLVLTFIFLPETSGEKILSDKAARLRKLTGNPIWKPASERAGRLTLGDAVRIYMVRPIALLIYEPIGESILEFLNTAFTDYA